MYKIINDLVVFLEDVGDTILVPTEKVDEMTGEKILVELHQPIYERKATYKLSEFVENMKYDLKIAKEKIDKIDSDKTEAIAQYNKLVEKLQEVRKDLPNLDLPDIKTIEVIK